MAPAPLRTRENGRGLPADIVAVWILFLVECVLILITYSRLREPLYHVSGRGFARAASRETTYLNFPVALAAIAVLAILGDLVPRTWARVLALVGVMLSAVVFYPGVVDQGDLDARWINVLPALGVLTGVALTIAAALAFGRIRGFGRRSRDVVRAVVAAVFVALALPWIAADLGFSFDGVPVLGTLFQTGELRTQPGDPTPHPAVHHGHHHGMDGVALVLTALLLSRVVQHVRTHWVRVGIGAYLALMFAYGVGEAANDAWLEQVVKRGWTNWEIPDVTQPKLSVAWGIVVLGATAIYAGATRFARVAEDRGTAKTSPASATARSTSSP